MDKILKKYNPNSLSWEQKAELKLLPPVLSQGVIALLLDLEKEDIYWDVISNAICKKELKPFVPNWSKEKRRLMIAMYGLRAVSVHIHKDDFKEWLEQCGEWPIDRDCLLANWWDDQEVEEIQRLTQNSKKDERKLGRRDRQINFILEILKQRKINPLEIPEGIKQVIKAECLKNISIFTKDGFKKAWTEANKRQLISMKDKEKYL